MVEHVFAVTDDTFDKEIIENDSPVLVDFWAEWCGPCRMFGPVLHEVAESYSGNVKFAKANTDENENIAYKYNVQSIPTIILFKNGKIVATNSGALTKAQLISFLNDNL